MTTTTSGPGLLGTRSSWYLSRGRRADLAWGLLAFVLALVSLRLHPDSLPVPVMWLPVGVVGGLYLRTEVGRRAEVLLGGSGLLALAAVLSGEPAAIALGTGLACLGEVWLLRALLGSTAGGSVQLAHTGEVSAMIRAVTVASAFGASVYAVVLLEVSGVGGLGLVWLAVWSTHAAALVMWAPLLAGGRSFPAAALRGERLLQWVVLVGSTVLIFAFSAVPPLVFLIMPTFAWLGYRGTLREASVLLAVVATIGSVFTGLGLGPVWGLVDRYSLAPGLAVGFLAMFLLDCALIMLPISVTVTAQREAAAAAAAEREALKEVVDSATGTGILTVDDEGRVTLFNPGAEAMLGYRAEEVLGRSVDLISAREAGRDRPSAPLSARLRAVARSDRPRREWHLQHRDGGTRLISMHLTELEGAFGSTAGLLATAEDVTEREEARQAVVGALRQQQEAIERLKDVDRVKNEFLATVSHELRTPLTSIRGYTELLREGAAGDLNADQHVLIERVAHNSERLFGLVEDLLLLSLVETGQLDLHREPLDLRDVVVRARGALGDGAEDRCLQVAAAPAGGAGAVRRRRRTAGADADQPAPQRREVHPERRTGPGRPARDAPRDRPGGRRHGGRDPRERAGPAVHQVLPAGRHLPRRHPGHRPGTGDRARDRRGARGPGPDRLLGGAGHHGQRAAPHGPGSADG